MSTRDSFAVGGELRADRPANQSARLSMRQLTRYRHIVATDRLYKLLPEAAWHEGLSAVPWAPIDQTDGFVHLSSGSQVRETARRHFKEGARVVLLTIDPDQLAAGELRWEPSRGGEDFPHVYGDIPRQAVVAVDVLSRASGGELVFPSNID